MRVGKKKAFLLCAVSAACLCFFGGCREEKQVKTDFETGFYSLTEAYENGWLTKADVKQIADYRVAVLSRIGCIGGKENQGICLERVFAWGRHYSCGELYYSVLRGI